MADYAFVRNTRDEVLLTLLVVRLYPSGFWFVCVADRKGHAELLIQRLAAFVRETGLVTFAYRSDREPALLTPLEEAIRHTGRDARKLLPGDDPDDVAEDMSEYETMIGKDIVPPPPDLHPVDRPSSSSGRTGSARSSSASSASPCENNNNTNEHDKKIKEAMRYLKSGDSTPVNPTLAMPEHSHPGGSQSNGRAERSVRAFVDLFACLKACVESRLELPQPIPCTHPVIRWLVEHVAFRLNRCQIDKEGRTPYGHLHGKDVQDHLCDLGEVVLWFVPKHSRAKLDRKWRSGLCWGRALHTDANYMGLNDGTFVAARAIVRVVAQNKWTLKRVNAIAGIPGSHRASFDSVKQKPNPIVSHPLNFQNLPMTLRRVGA